MNHVDAISGFFFCIFGYFGQHLTTFGLFWSFYNQFWSFFFVHCFNLAGCLPFWAIFGNAFSLFLIISDHLWLHFKHFWLHYNHFYCNMTILTILNPHFDHFWLILTLFWLILTIYVSPYSSVHMDNECSIFELFD